jgi:hypothetical protein
MQCPHCSNLLMHGDTACPTCGQRVVQNQTQFLWSYGLAILFAGLMYLAVNTVTPPNGADEGAWNFACWLFVLGALVMGKVLGWVIGAFVAKD